MVEGLLMEFITILITVLLFCLISAACSSEPSDSAAAIVLPIIAIATSPVWVPCAIWEWMFADDVPTPVTRQERYEAGLSDWD